MKHINFITTLSPQHQYELRRWFIFSTILIACTLICMSFFFLPQLYALYSTKKEITSLQQKTKNFSELTTRQTQLKKEHEALQKKQTKINHHLNTPNNPHPYLTSIIAACGTDVQLEHVRKNKKECEIIALFSTPERATDMIQQLSLTGQFTKLTLASLQSDAQTKKLRCTIKAKIE
jgi:Tfp pilus assembly protein PilN